MLLPTSFAVDVMGTISMVKIIQAAATHFSSAPLVEHMNRVQCYSTLIAERALWSGYLALKSSPLLSQSFEYPTILRFRNLFYKWT